MCIRDRHGTSGGSSVKTLCHPDGSPKVTGGTTGAGATTAVAVSAGMTFADGTAESKVTLAMAKILKDKLLAEGYDVLMIRESDDVQLDNVARTVIANNNADCHIALHWDSTSTDKGAFYMSVPSNASYRAMEPVASHWQQHNQLGECLVAGLRGAGVKIFSGGSMEMDLTQTSYSTIPSIDIELGDKASSHSDATLSIQADGLVAVSYTHLLKEEDPLAVINGRMVPALDRVGKGFEKGTIFLPQLLMSAEAAREAFAVIKEHLSKDVYKRQRRVHP